MVSKFSIVFFLTNLIGHSYCDSICVYYANYPVDQTFQTITCAYGCCGSSFPTKASDACCPAPNNTWLAYPIVFISLLVTGSIIYAFCCSKFKPSALQARFKKINPSSTRAETEVPISQEVPSVYSINSNFSSERSTNSDGQDDWMYNRISSAPPPKYEEVFHTQNNTLIQFNLNGNEVMPVLPGSCVPYNETKK